MSTSTTRAGRSGIGGIGALVALAGLAGLLGGCATTGEGPGAGTADSMGSATTTKTPAAGVVERDFYADWYDSTAVVLPPPPDAKARR